MAASIQVEARADGTFAVTVVEGRGRTSHVVSVDEADRVRLGGAATPAADLVRASFEFLLAREPKESILGRFALPLIGRYFPEYEREMRRRFGVA
jgi:hypothetical protein